MRIKFNPLNFKAIVLVIGVFFALLAAACGGSPEPGNNEDSESNQQSSQSASNTLDADEACEAFAGIGGLAGLGGLGGFAGFASSAQGGPSVQANYSSSPPSDEAEEIAEFFEDALEEALDGSVSAECYWEVSATEGGETNRAIWVSLKIPGAPDSGDVTSIQSVLGEKGASVAGGFSGAAQGQSSTMIMVNDLPLDIDGQTGGMLMLTDEFAILIAGQDTGSSSQSSATTPSPTPATASSASGSSSAAPPVTEPSPTVFPLSSFNAQSTIETLEDDLEDALGVDLELEGNFQSSTAQGVVVVITYNMEEGSSAPSDAADLFEDMAESSGATITAKISVQGAAIVNFEGYEIEGASATGSIALAQDQNSIVVNLTIQ